MYVNRSRNNCEMEGKTSNWIIPIRHSIRVLSAKTNINISNWPLLRHINYEIMIRKKVGNLCIFISHHDLIEMASLSSLAKKQS